MHVCCMLCICMNVCLNWMWVQNSSSYVQICLNGCNMNNWNEANERMNWVGFSSFPFSFTSLTHYSHPNPLRSLWYGEDSNCDCWGGGWLEFCFRGTEEVPLPPPLAWRWGASWPKVERWSTSGLRPRYPPPPPPPSLATLYRALGVMLIKLVVAYGPGELLLWRRPLTAPCWPFAFALALLLFRLKVVKFWTSATSA